MNIETLGERQIRLGIDLSRFGFSGEAQQVALVVGTARDGCWLAGGRSTQARTRSNVAVAARRPFHQPTICSRLMKSPLSSSLADSAGVQSKRHKRARSL